MSLREFQVGVPECGEPSLFRPTQALWPFRSVHTDGYGSHTQAEAITSPQCLRMQPQKLGVSGQGKITHLPARNQQHFLTPLSLWGRRGTEGVNMNGC